MEQPKKEYGFTRFEWLGFIVMVFATFCFIGFPPANLVDWFSWLLDTSHEQIRIPLRALSTFLIFIYFMTVLKYRRQAFHDLDLYPALVKSKGVSILSFASESSARDAGMQRGDVIVEYGSETDITIEKLSAITVKKTAEIGQVSVVFMRDGQRLSKMLPSGSLGISAMDTTVSVPVR
ncbi:hypothetical protein [Desulfomonile tiedjei]|uniref:hypothetical protein n=1 Tax=Desulfomonile tiedjei TaxID=2358 RepID=UPI0002EB900E|nr:hypothetical protein [Desulfomonile tiedjei]